MEAQFKAHLSNTFPFLKTNKILIAVSGGIDSVVLSYLCNNLNLAISIAHCNFNLRGKASDADQDFVEHLGQKLGVQVFVKGFDTNKIAQEKKWSIQVAARNLRYQWFLELVQTHGFDYVLTGHHADDNLETFLINLSRGTGLDGLTGIPEMNKTTLRPLLPFSREVIKKLALQKKWQWREDASNASTKYLRNALRHKVIPALKTITPEFLNHFKTTQKHLQESQYIVLQAILDLKKRVCVYEGDIIKIDINILKTIPNYQVYLQPLLKTYLFTEWQTIYHLIEEAQTGKFVTSKTHRLTKNRAYLLLSKLHVEHIFEPMVVPRLTTEIKTPLGDLKLKQVNTVGNINTNVIYVDAESLNFPLTIRSWQEGDYFYPLGMQGKKKLSKYFKDEKWSVLEKKQAVLLCSSSKIVWILNARMDNRFKVTQHTKTILKIYID